MERKEFYESMIGKESNWHRMEYTWKDSAFMVWPVELIWMRRNTFTKKK